VFKFFFSFQQLCDEWLKKPEAEQEFAPFFRAVSAVANSTGTRLKTRVQLLNQVGAVVSFHLYIFSLVCLLFTSWSWFPDA
jgi:hypothetical protein